jgi:hypothetical protein
VHMRLEHPRMRRAHDAFARMHVCGDAGGRSEDVETDIYGQARVLNGEAGARHQN